MIEFRVNYLSCIDGKGVSIDICCTTQNPSLFVSLFQNLFWTKSKIKGRSNIKREGGYVKGRGSVPFSINVKEILE